MLEEFRKFAMRGNVVDLAVGFVIGAAFGGIVTSLVNDIIMPIIGAATGGLDFSNYYTPLSAKVQSGRSYADAKKQGRGPRLGPVSHRHAELPHYCLGALLGDQGHQQIAREQPPAPAPGPTPEVKLLTEIRDLLKTR